MSRTFLYGVLTLYSAAPSWLLLAVLLIWSDNQCHPAQIAVSRRTMRTISISGMQYLPASCPPTSAKASVRTQIKSTACHGAPEILQVWSADH